MEQRCGCASGHLLQHRGCMDRTGLPSPSPPKGSYPSPSLPQSSCPSPTPPHRQLSQPIPIPQQLSQPNPTPKAAIPAHPHPMTAILAHSHLTAAIPACPHPTAPIPALLHPNPGYPCRHCCPNLSSPCFFPVRSPGSKSTLCPTPGPLAKADDQNSCACPGCQEQRGSSLSQCQSPTQPSAHPAEWAGMP